MDSKFWYVWRINGGVPSFKHSTYEQAAVEAGRLAQQTGGEFLILEAIATVKPAPKTVTTVLGENGMPY